MERRDVVIVGSGVAGAATAWFLRNKHSVSDILVLEREPTPASRASGQNAGIARQLVETFPMAQLAKRSVDFLSSPPAGFSETPVFSRTGGILTVRARRDSRLSGMAAIAARAGARYEPIGRAEVLERVPVLDEAPFAAAVHCDTDGVVDIHSLVSSFLRGTEVRTSTPASGFSVSGGRVTAVSTPSGDVGCRTLVMAAGAFTEKMALLLGLKHIMLEARRRHLAISAPLDGIGPAMPYYWSLDPQVYFRYESKGLLFSPCDETAIDPDSLRPSPEAPSWLYERLRIAAPRLLNVPIIRFWAELRTFSFDNNFVIGFDPEIGNLLWVTALQGHGITCSAGVGEMAADLVAGARPGADPAPHSPSRFV